MRASNPDLVNLAGRSLEPHARGCRRAIIHEGLRSKFPCDPTDCDDAVDGILGTAEMKEKRQTRPNPQAIEYEVFLRT